MLIRMHGLLRGLASHADCGLAVLVHDLDHADGVHVDLGAVRELFVQGRQFVRLGLAVLEGEDHVHEMNALAINHHVVVTDDGVGDLLLLLSGEGLVLTGFGP